MALRDAGEGGPLSATPGPGTSLPFVPELGLQRLLCGKPLSALAHKTMSAWGPFMRCRAMASPPALSPGISSSIPRAYKPPPPAGTRLAPVGAPRGWSEAAAAAAAGELTEWGDAGRNEAALPLFILRPKLACRPAAEEPVSPFGLGS